jgi:hypothetical protein
MSVTSLAASVSTNASLGVIRAIAHSVLLKMRSFISKIYCFLIIRAFLDKIKTNILTF